MDDGLDLGKRQNRTTPTPIHAKGTLKRLSQRVYTQVRPSSTLASHSWGQYGRGYLMKGAEREGNERGHGFNAEREDRDVGKEMSAWQQAKDPYYYRFVVKPERLADMDVKAYTRTLMEQVEKDLGQNITWEAVEHRDKKTPDIHIVVRGVDDQGKKLQFPYRYQRNTFNERGREIATQAVGYRLDGQALAHGEKTIDRQVYTEVDQRLLGKAHVRVIDLAREHPVTLAQETRLNQEQRRLVQLSQWGLAKEIAPQKWEIYHNLRQELRFRAANREHAPEWRKSQIPSREQERTQENTRNQERTRALIRTVVQEKTLERGRGR